MNKETKHEDVLISLSDVLLILKKGKKKILAAAIFCAFLASLYILTEPVKYQSEATFKDKGKKQTSIGASSIGYFIGDMMSNTDNEASSYLKSNKVIIPVIQKMHLQGVIFPKNAKGSVLRLIKNNLAIEYAYFRNRVTPLFPDSYPPLKLQNIVYDGEIPLVLEAKFLSDVDFEVRDHKKKLLGQGKIGEPFVYEEATFTIVADPEVFSPENINQYIIVFQPMTTLAKGIKANLKVTVDKADKTLIKLEYKDYDRQKVSEILNEFMNAYQDYVISENNRISQKQLDYLFQREKETSQNLLDYLEEHAKSVAAGFSSSGFPDSEKEMEFLGKSQQESRQRLQSIELESKRLNALGRNDYAYYDRFYSTGDAEIINTILGQIRHFKKERDSLAIALNKKSNTSDAEHKDFFETNLKNLEEVQLTTAEVKHLLNALRSKKEIAPSSKLMSNPNLLVGTWYQRLRDSFVAWRDADAHEKDTKLVDCENCKSNFEAYLENLSRLYEVHEKMISEKLVYQQSPKHEFEGINIETAAELYRNFNRQLYELQASIRQHNFILEQIHQPGFEISSLSAILQDPVSREMITKATNTAIAIKDTNNRSAKEIDRLVEELDLQKKFLALHIEQTRNLNQISEQLVNEKISATQNVNLELINQQVSILENHLSEYLNTRSENLKQEKRLIEQHLLDLKSQMAKLPKKWVSEQILNQRLRLNSGIMEEVTRLVETKNISHHLDTYQSAPLDHAISPILPKKPNLFFFVVLGTILGSGISFASLLFQTINRGITASEENLRLAKQHFSGFLSNRCQNNSKESLLDQDLETLRHAISYTTAKELPSDHTILLLQGEHPDYSECFASLLAKRKAKVLLIQIAFDTTMKLDPSQSLLPYLEGKGAFPKVHQGAEFDTIFAGGISRFSSELLTSKTFITLLDSFKKQYDYIVASSHAMPTSAEAISLMQVFDRIVVNLTDETVQDLEPYVKKTFEVPCHKRITFVISSQ